MMSYGFCKQNMKQHIHIWTLHGLIWSRMNNKHKYIYERYCWEYMKLYINFKYHIWQNSSLWINITQPTTHIFSMRNRETITRTTGSETNFWATPLVLEYSNDGRNTLYSTITTWASNNGSYNRTFPKLNST